ncbi:hypothetical protein ACIA98_34715 [Streptomyces sp. NPDC051366]|uniref:hypothetical protein n=1 Tax=Streptomyces sp. NPDC051366 TaxID=3365652 RepID=UPI0037B7CAAE
MSDIYELIVTVDLRNELSEQQLAELRWHLGIGPQPAGLAIVTEFPFVVVDDEGNLEVEDDPHPLLAGSGAAEKVGGALCSALAGREDLAREGWSLTSRIEIHPDEVEKVGELLCWLADRAHDTHRLADGAVRMGYYRWYEELTPHVLKVENGQINLLEATGTPTTEE